MSVRTSGAQGSLNALEERIRRSLGLAGLIEADFSGVATPVVIVDDATRPGSQTLRNRAFADRSLISLAGGGVVSSAAWQAQQNMIIDALFLNPRDAGSTFPAVDFSEFTVDLFLAVPGTTPTYAVATLAGLFTEVVNLSNQDRPGLLRGNGGTWIASTAFGTYGCRAGESLHIPLRVFLPPGGFLALNASTNSEAAVNGILSSTMHGRIY